MERTTRAIAAVLARARPGALRAVDVTVHFQPAARDALGRPVLEAVLDDGRWRSQFETGTSNGGATAFPGGDRWRWESRLFGGAYDDAPPVERPVYGGLRLSTDPYGAAPRFGSAHLRLRREVLERTTVCFPDSVHEPEAFGTIDLAGAVLDALGRLRLGDPLDRYVEAHVHGGVAAVDVAAVVLDPSYSGTPLHAAVAGRGVPIEWHPGYALSPDALQSLDDYRGPDVARTARRIAGGGVLTPAILSSALDEERVDAVTAKHVWHLLAAFGRRVGRTGTLVPNAAR